MRKRNRKAPCRKIVLRLPDPDHAKSAVLNSLSSPCSRRNCKFAMDQFRHQVCLDLRENVWIVGGGGEQNGLRMGGKMRNNSTGMPISPR